MILGSCQRAEKPVEHGVTKHLESAVHLLTGLCDPTLCLLHRA